MQQGRRGIGSRKHGVSGRASKSPRFRLMNRLAAERGEFGAVPAPRRKGVAVIIEAAHQCMTTRGVHKPGVTMVTSRMLGAFRDDPSSRREVLTMIGTPGGAKLDNV